MIRALGLSLILSVSTSCLFAGPMYNVTNLGDLKVTKINNAGVAIGFTDPGGYYGSPSHFNTSGDPQGYTYDSRTGAINSITPLSIESPYAVPYDINSAGQVVGNVISGNANNAHAFLVQGGVTKDLGPDVVGGINDSGERLRTQNDALGNPSYYVESNGVKTPINVPGFTPAGLSATGAVFGTLADGRPASWQNGAMTLYPTVPLSTEAASGPQAMNAAGQIVGAVTSSDLNKPLQSYIAGPNGFFKDLSAAGGPILPTGINAAGLVIGSNTLAQGVLYTNGKLTALNELIDPSLAWNIRNAISINDAGQILALGTIDATGQTSTLLLTPSGLPIPVAPVPEPTTLVLFGLVGCGLIAWRRKVA